MIRIRIPFGDGPHQRAEPLASLSAGTLWQPDFGSSAPNPGGYTSTIEAGFWWSEGLLLKLRPPQSTSHAEGAEPAEQNNAVARAAMYCEQNVMMCVGGAIVGVGLLGFIGK